MKFEVLPEDFDMNNVTEYITKQVKGEQVLVTDLAFHLCLLKNYKTVCKHLLNYTYELRNIQCHLDNMIGTDRAKYKEFHMEVFREISNLQDEVSTLKEKLLSFTEDRKSPGDEECSTKS